ncbi:hypothetical protein H2200_009659 [Cladophialophora chaetospira]|uniref:Uncharacterized protein n=1 Tax=Cladophialophora chaetospira TaxID=386627 RepID=A0AA39CES1_9EURO|nr:hypothetical protein H2200_009659 [Cladophialophora chaetospira]
MSTNVCPTCGGTGVVASYSTQQPVSPQNQQQQYNPGQYGPQYQQQQQQPTALNANQGYQGCPPQTTYGNNAPPNPGAGPWVQTAQGPQAWANHNIIHNSGHAKVVKLKDEIGDGWKGPAAAIMA